MSKLSEEINEDKVVSDFYEEQERFENDYSIDQEARHDIAMDCIRDAYEEYSSNDVICIKCEKENGKCFYGGCSRRY